MSVKEIRPRAGAVFPAFPASRDRSSVLAPDSIEELMAGSLARVYGTTHQGTLLRKKRSRLYPLPFGTIPRKTGATGESASRLESRRFGFSLGPWLRKEQTQLEACQVVQPRHPDQGSGTIPPRYLPVRTRIESRSGSAGRHLARIHSRDRHRETVHPGGKGYLSASRLGFLLRVGIQGEYPPWVGGPALLLWQWNLEPLGLNHDQCYKVGLPMPCCLDRRESLALLSGGLEHCGRGSDHPPQLVPL